MHEHKHEHGRVECANLLLFAHIIYSLFYIFTLCVYAVWSVEAMKYAVANGFAMVIRISQYNHNGLKMFFT